MTLSAKVFYYRAAATSCVMIVASLLLLPNDIIAGVLSLLPSGLVNSGTRIVEWLGMSHHLEHLVHAVIYCSLTIVSLLAWQGRIPSAVILVTMLAYSGFMELLQIPIPDHAPEAGDILANLTGVVSGWAATWGPLKLTKAYSPSFTLKYPRDRLRRKTG